MILAGLYVGAQRGYLYMGHDYGEQHAIFIAELDRCAQQGLIGRGLFGTNDSFEITLFDSPGGYICGEQSALLECIEGRRAEPRTTPPHIAEEGLWGRPTIVNNVETLAFAAAIAAQGAEWFNSYGANGVRGLKFISLSGDVQNPGVYEVPMGIKYSDIIEQYGGGVLGRNKLIAFAPSGPESGYLPASMADLPLDFASLHKAGSMLGTAAIVVCAEGRCMVDLALNAVRFLRNESCGKCVPCRIGSQRVVEILERWTSGQPNSKDIAVINDLSEALRLASLCGLGQVVPAPIQSVLKYFPSEVDEHLIHRRCPAGVCFS